MTDFDQPCTIVIAPDSFKGTASAADAARAIAAGWASVRPADRLHLAPMADGGEGTLDAFEAAVPGATRMPITVRGPDDGPVDSHWLQLPDGTAVVELANTSGITLIDELDPLGAHSLGFGQAIAAALQAGARRLLLAIGGSASTDGGVGTLVALGAEFTDEDDRPIRLGNIGLGTVATIDSTRLRPVPPGGAQILSDVTNPLLGAAGAAAVFGPQKGATIRQVARLDSNLRRLARLVRTSRFGHVDPDAPGAGAAGGVGFGLLAWGATMSRGSGTVGEALGLPQAVAGAQLVITGEGRFDAQSAAGKVPGYVAGVAATVGVPILLVAGSIDTDPTGFADCRSLARLAGSADAAMADPLVWLEIAGARLAETVGSSA